MALRDKIQTNVQPSLRDGETIQSAFPTQTKSGWWAALGLLGTVKDLVGEAPLAPTLGEPSGLWRQCTALPEPLYVHKRFHKDVVAANGFLAGRQPA